MQDISTYVCLHSEDNKGPQHKMAVIEQAFSIICSLTQNTTEVCYKDYKYPFIITCISIYHEISVDGIKANMHQDISSCLSVLKVFLEWDLLF